MEIRPVPSEGQLAVKLRLGTIVLGVGGLGLAALMAYTLVFDVSFFAPRGDEVATRDVPEVVVFFPNPVDWRDFVESTELCERHGITRIVDRKPGKLTVATPQTDRRLRFVWNSTGGLRGARDQVRSLIQRPKPPIAFIGAATSTLTVALAQQLGEEAEAHPENLPLLLIPWATTVMVEPEDTSESPVALLALYPDRSFRFCPNNRRQADFITDCVVASTAPDKPPGRAYLVVDRKDLYSTDLADAFRRSIARVSPEAEIIEEPGVVSGQGSPEVPTAREHALAERIWSELVKSTQLGPTWVVLPLQAEPCRRMLAALRIHARPTSSNTTELQVLCGDGISIKELAVHAVKAEFPVWCISPSVAPYDGPAGVVAATVPAEIIATLMHVLDTITEPNLTAGILGQALIAMESNTTVLNPFGRPIAFSASGERKGDSSGYILTSKPGSSQVLAIDRGGEGQWLPPVPLPTPVAFRP